MLFDICPECFGTDCRFDNDFGIKWPKSDSLHGICATLFFITCILVADASILKFSLKRVASLD